MSTVAESEGGGTSEHFPLAERLRERIRHSGPITFRDWMAVALYDPVAGYYCRNDRQRWGREGDYRTSPERSPLFAATFARYFAQLYEALNHPAQWTIVEMGAGAGQFAERLLVTLEAQFPKVFEATKYVIEDLGEGSRATAEKRLQVFGERVSFQSLYDLQQIEVGLIFSNELLDSFPVHRVTLRADQLCEFYVVLDESGNFQWSLGPISAPSIAAYFSDDRRQLSSGQIIEINFGIEDWLKQVAQHLRKGYLLTVDYGVTEFADYHAADRQQGTLRAFREHQFVDDVLGSPGEQDLTTTIDWSFVKQAGEALGFETVCFERQDRFLLRVGLLDELAALVASADSEAERVQLRTQSREMILPNGMSAAFQVLVQKVTGSG